MGAKDEGFVEGPGKNGNVLLRSQLVGWPLSYGFEIVMIGPIGRTVIDDTVYIPYCPHCRVLCIVLFIYYDVTIHSHITNLWLLTQSITT